MISWWNVNIIKHIGEVEKIKFETINVKPKICRVDIIKNGKVDQWIEVKSIAQNASRGNNNGYKGQFSIWKNNMNPAGSNTHKEFVLDRIHAGNKKYTDKVEWLFQDFKVLVNDAQGPYTIKGLQDRAVMAWVRNRLVEVPSWLKNKIMEDTFKLDEGEVPAYLQEYRNVRTTMINPESAVNWLGYELLPIPD